MNRVEEYIRAKLFSDYLTSSSNRMDKAEKCIREKPSGWYYADLAVAIVTVLGLGFTWISIIYQAIFYIPVIAFAAIIIVLLCKKYYLVRLAKPWRIAAGFIRVTLYAVVLLSFAVPFIMFTSDDPALYPVQKEIYRLNYVDRGERVLYFLPDNIPDDAGDYKIKMFPGLMQAEDYIRIEFFTSSGQLTEYRNFAQSCGAVKTEAICVNEVTGREETVESWKFHIYGDRYAVYFIWPESGYFTLTW